MTTAQITELQNYWRASTMVLTALRDGVFSDDVEAAVAELQGISLHTRNNRLQSVCLSLLVSLANKTDVSQTA